LHKVGFGSGKLGELNAPSLRLQADLAHLISSRGGAVAAKLAAEGKPSSWSSTAYNLGVTKNIAKHINDQYSMLNQEYKDLTGKELPYKLSDYVQSAAQHAKSKLVTIKYKGKTFSVPQDKAEKFSQLEGATVEK
jgi:hypothetical protein